MAKYSSAQNKSTQKYIRNNYDEIKIRVPKGDREKYKKIAEEKGVSLNYLVVSYLESLIEK